MAQTFQIDPDMPEGTIYILDDEFPVSIPVVEANAIVVSYDTATGWNGSLEVPTKNAVYDKIEQMNEHRSEVQLCWSTQRRIEEEARKARIEVEAVPARARRVRVGPV